MESRYDRQLPIIGEEGQDKLESAVVGIIGCGGLGTNVATALASAGIGELVLMDGDSPSLTNLNRQYVYRENQTSNKSALLAYWLSSVNPDVSVHSIPEYLTEDNSDLLDRCDILIDCLDSISARKVLNRYAMATRKKLIHGGVSGMQGQVTVMIPGTTPCLECILKINAKGHVLPSICPAVMTIGAIEAMEAIKVITGVGEPLTGKLLVIDLESEYHETIDLHKNPRCAVCGKTVCRDE